MSASVPGGPDIPGRPQGVDALTELAMDLRWSWNHCTDELWRRLDPGLWEQTHHPNVVLQGATRERIAGALADPEFSRLLDTLVRARRQAVGAPGWFQQKHPK